MRELLARTAADQVADHRFTEAIEAIRRRVDAIEEHMRELRQTRSPATGPSDESAADAGQSLAGIAASLDGLAGSLGTFDSRLSGMIDSRLASTDARLSALDNRIERLDERLDDQYDRVNSADSKLTATNAKLDALATDLRARPDRTEVAEIIDEARTDIAARVTSLEETVLTLAEALLRPPVLLPHPQENGKNSAILSPERSP
jgi:chromosome segregation ATPase